MRRDYPSHGALKYQVVIGSLHGSVVFNLPVVVDSKIQGYSNHVSNCLAISRIRRPKSLCDKLLKSVAYTTFETTITTGPRIFQNFCQLLGDCFRARLTIHLPLLPDLSDHRHRCVATLGTANHPRTPLST